MDIPEKITLVDGYYFTDGGSIVLIAETPDSNRRQITLGQHRILEYYDPNVLPGRLYWDSQLVPVRSELEADLIALLETSEIAPGEPPEPEKEAASSEAGPVVVVGDDLKEYYAKMAEGKRATIRYLRASLIKFVRSRKYVRIAKKVGGG